MWHMCVSISICERACGPCLHLDVTCVWWMFSMLPCTRPQTVSVILACSWLIATRHRQTLWPQTNSRLRSSSREWRPPRIETGRAAPDLFRRDAPASTKNWPAETIVAHDSIFPRFEKLSSSHRKGTRTCSKHKDIQQERLPVASSLWHVQKSSLPSLGTLFSATTFCKPKFALFFYLFSHSGDIKVKIF